jgi:biotin operon repressor
MEKAEVVLKAMKDAGKPVRPGQVAEATGIDKKELSKIIKELKKDGKIISPKQCFYSLPE